ncbi:TPR_9 domain-containing protein [Cephalotus follicularis]|uniref:TPR_9 domain-containing protein n=1 Tax=Cephalotus follicularis TaxID=3775 RepID=A0A1Q3D9K9_CEPFO|nr:TPR_9 domain-containing protein [Cephalotus follicularis]
MGSIKASTLHSQTEIIHHTKFLHHNCLKPPCTTNPPYTQKHSLLFQLIKFHISPKPTQFITHHIPHTPVPSNLSNLTNSLPPQKAFSKFFVEKLVTFVVGSFVFMAWFNARPSLAALPVKMATSSANTKEKRDTLMEKSEEEDMYEKVLEKEPRNVKALKVVVYAKMKRGKNKEAVIYVERLIDIEPEEVEWRLLQALCYEMMGQLSMAKKLFKDILEERPLLLRALHGLAMVMHKKLEGPAVFEMLGKALEIARRGKRVTEERSIRILIAQMHVVKGELEEGLKEFEDLVNENPRDFRPYLCQGIIYSLLDKKKEAAEQFEIYRSLVPEEFPQRGFLDDVVLAAKTKPQDHLQKEFDAEFSYQK